MLPFQHEGPAQESDIALALRELLAFAVRAGLSPTARARIATAAAELLENVQRHAYGDGAGTFTLSARLERSALELSVGDRGLGLDPVAISAGPLCDGSRSGLARAAALAEDLRIESTAGAGTRIELRFAVAPAAFDIEGEVDLSELDFLTPALARRVLESVRDGGDPRYELSPALAVAVGRLLAGVAPARSLRTALWS